MISCGVVPSLRSPFTPSLPLCRSVISYQQWNRSLFFYYTAPSGSGCSWWVEDIMQEVIIDPHLSRSWAGCPNPRRELHSPSFTTVTPPISNIDDDDDEKSEPWSCCFYWQAVDFMTPKHNLFMVKGGGTWCYMQALLHVVHSSSREAVNYLCVLQFRCYEQHRFPFTECILWLFCFHSFGTSLEYMNYSFTPLILSW